MEAQTLRPRKQLYIQLAIFVQALVAMLGSLYFSTFGDIVKNIQNGNLFPVDEGLIPCELCWFARILMYPIVILSLVGIIRKDNKFTTYVLALALPGILLEIYHYSIQKLPIQNIFNCSLANPCAALQVNYLGFITIPFLCGVAFTVIAILSIINLRMEKKKSVLTVKV